MSYRKRRSGRAFSLPTGVAIGVGSILLLSLIAIMLLAWLIATEKVGQGSLGYAIMGIEVVASFIGCWISNSLIKHRNLLVSIMTCIAYYFTLVLLGLALGGLHEGMIVTAAMILLGGGISQIPALIGSNSGARKRKISTYR